MSRPVIFIFIPSQTMDDSVTNTILKAGNIPSESSEEAAIVRIGLRYPQPPCAWTAMLHQSSALALFKVHICKCK